VKAEVAQNIPVTINCQTNYPFDETIKMSVSLSASADFPISLRIPEWCANPTIKVNGETLKIERQINGFVRIFQRWKGDDLIELTLPMTAKVVQGNETPYPQISYFDKYHKMAKNTTILNPYACVYYGPLLFSFPIPDISPDQEVQGTRFNFALDVKPGEASRKITVERSKMPEHWSWPIDAPVKLSVNTLEFDWQPDENKVLPEKPVEKGTPVKIHLVPYGTTKFRVTMFPVTKASFQK
jgi:hypothetical protein